MAVVGVSLSNDRNPANAVFQKLLLRYPVQVFAVNPKGGRLQRETVYRRLSDIPEKIDHVVIAVRAESVPAVVEDCIRAGAAGATIISGGFSERGRQELQSRIVQMAAAANMPVIGPNCLGVYAPGRFDTFFLPGERLVQPEKGNVAMISQSGGVLSDIGGVAVGIGSDAELRTVWRRFARREAFSGVLLEKMVNGLELIVGGKIDVQFGPVVLLGIGGKGVEIYKDRTLRMAPIQDRDVLSMVRSLTAGRLLSGFRGESPIDMQALIGLMTAFSKILLKMADQITSVDLNPVICSAQGCVAADARIILKGGRNDTTHPEQITADSHSGPTPR